MGKKAPKAISATFDGSYIPSQRMNKGTQAREGMLRRDCSSGSSRSRAVRDTPAIQPRAVAVRAPSRKPWTTRQLVIAT